MFSVGAYDAHAEYHTHVCDVKIFYIICEVIFTALCYYGEFLDLRNWRYKGHYRILTESRLQCVLKTGKEQQILSRKQKREK
jgi:hypothetical protein